MRWDEVIEEPRSYLSSGESIPPRAYAAIKLAADALEFIDNGIRGRDHREAPDGE